MTRPSSGRKRRPKGPASLSKRSEDNTTPYVIGSSNPEAPIIDTKGMSCLDFQVATETSDADIEPYILSLLKDIGDADDASWRAENPKLSCPSKEELMKHMKPHVNANGDTMKYFFYSNFQDESLTLAFKAAHYPSYTHFTEIWKDKSWAIIHSEAPYSHLFAVRASEIFASRAEGNCVAILPPGNGAEKTWHLTSLWSLELSILMAEPKVKSIWRVDVNGKGSEMKPIATDSVA